jgi:hypothetical protein
MIIASSARSAAQTDPRQESIIKPLIFKLNDDGSRFIRLQNWHQIWMTYTENNPGTADINGKPMEHSLGIGLRRSRFVVLAQLTKRLTLFTHWGINNQLFDTGGTPPNGPNTGVSNGGKKPQLFVHEAYGSYAVWPEKMTIGAGLHCWNGVSRLASASTVSFMTLDAPMINWPNIETNDQFARQFGIFAKGDFSKLNYRVFLNKPFAYGSSTTYPAPPGTVSFAFGQTAGYNLNENWASGGYLSWQFWDKEATVQPYVVGTYLGSKKVLNVGAGWYWHPKAMASVDTMRTAGVLDTVARYYAQQHFGVDAYLDMPLGGQVDNRGCLNAYLLYQNLGYGNRFVRNLGVMNEHLNPQLGNGDSWAGSGNAQPTFGTGSILYAQVGYAFPKFKNGQQLMPYATATYKDFQGLKDPSLQFDLGLNYFIAAHGAKITLQYGSRPVYRREAATGDIVRTGLRGQWTLQTQVAF